MAQLAPFIIWIGVAADVVKMVDSGILLFYFVRASLADPRISGQTRKNFAFYSFGRKKCPEQKP